MGLFDRLKQGLSRTTQGLVSKFGELARRVDQGPSDTALDADTAESLEELLVAADVGVGAAHVIVEAVRKGSAGGGLRARVKGEILRMFDEASQAHPPSLGGAPRVVLVVGVNGVGKTTTLGKLAAALKAAGQTPMVCAADTFRAAAVEQLEIWATRAGVEIVRAAHGADPAAVVFDAIQSGRAKGCDPILVDTAGRLHNRVNLMNELEKMRRVAGRAMPGAPHDVLLVLDATVGQNGLVQAREFLGVAGVTGIVLTKLDGTAKGGIAVAIAHDLKLPIRYVGIGEGIDDLIPFDATAYVDALFDAA
ncbi:MAG: signal recognition particle-docking protein FtsY [Vicinamibacterales bacterium]